MGWLIMKKFESAQDVVNSVIDKDGLVKSGFSGIGKFRGRSDYNEDERTVLSYFFTNIDSNVTCATDQMPGELWALLMGQYARSSLTARDRLLKLFEDMSSKQDAISVSGLAGKIRSGSGVYNELQDHIQKAGKFIEDWGISYGHASLRDSGVIRIASEGVSQRITKDFEGAREGAYQEQSTRALPFTEEILGMPYEYRGRKEEGIVVSLDGELLAFYGKINDRLNDHLRRSLDYLRKEANEKIASETGRTDITVTDIEWNSLIGAKTFDVARYLLPQNMTTSLGITLNTRRFQDQLTEWQSSPLWELQVLGKVAQIEAMKVSGNLMKYGNKSEFSSEIPYKLKEICADFLPKEKGMEYKHYDVSSELVGVTEDLEDVVLASVMLNGSDGSRSFSELKEIASKLSAEDRRKIAQKVLEGKQSHELYPKIMEAGNVMFDRLYDIGAYRDLQRQRGDRQQRNMYSVVGYNMPKEIAEIGLDGEYKALMLEVKQVYDDFSKGEFPFAAEYIPVMANVLRHFAQADPVQKFYEAKLRTQPAGIDSYRSIMIQETEALLKHLPAFKGLVEYDNNNYILGRLPEMVRRKIEKAKE